MLIETISVDEAQKVAFSEVSTSRQEVAVFVASCAGIVVRLLDSVTEKDVEIAVSNCVRVGVDVQTDIVVGSTKSSRSTSPP